MRVVESTNHNGTYNLVLEKYLLDRYTEDVFIIWHNEPGVYIGKNQNTLDEIDLNFIKEHRLDVFRRLSGGGTIFHDMNTVYYSFITKNTRSVKENFIHWNNVIVDFLNSVGVTAVLSGRNDVLVNERKVSGSAEHYKDHLVVHHGSLLFQTDIPFLAGALTPNQKKFISKAVKSVKARVDNISNYTDIDRDTFMRKLSEYVVNRFGGVKKPITNLEDEQVQTMIKTHYGTYEWNYGKSPKYEFVKEDKYPYGIVSIAIQVKDGVVDDLHISGDFFSERDITELSNRFIGVKYQKEELEKVLESIPLSTFIVGANKEDLLHLMW